MSDLQQLERELQEYLNKEPNLRRGDRLEYLRTIFSKHLEINKLEHVINSADLYNIISGAKSSYNKAKLPMRITNRQVDTSELPHVALIESFIGYLTNMHLVKKFIKFDYTD